MTTGAIVSEDERRALHDERLQIEALTRLSGQRLRDGDHYGAFIFADRRCRLAIPRPYDLLLRSEALRRMGFAASAAADLSRAVASDPTDSVVMRRVIEADDEGSDAAARWVIADPRSARGLVDRATRHLLKKGLRVVGSIVVDEDRMTGWVSWHGQRIYALRIETRLGRHDIRLPPRPNAPADEQVPAPAPLSVRLPAPFVSLSVLSDDRPFAQAYVPVRANPTAVRPAAAGTAAPRVQPAAAARLVTIIVPVYDDVEVTRACLTSLAAQLSDGVVIRVVLVDDAAPAPEMTALLVEMSERHGFELLVNRRNLGFIGAVNRALERVESGDIVLLNADVVLPPRAVAKLAAAAYARPGVGIVNPLTNNGQFNSFPAMFGANPFEDQRRITAIDAVAGATAAGLLVETPGAIGYCMYVTRACLDAVGPIPEVYLRGYYEDVEFCLRARERGFAAVCAPNIYVGHKGSVSFKGEKQGLVARNERVNDLRFPQLQAELRAFRRADPLRGIRAAIEAEAFPLARIDVIVAGSALYAPVLRARAEALGRASTSALVLSWSASNGEIVAQLHRTGDPEPRQSAYPLQAQGVQGDLVKAVLALKPVRIEVAGAPGAFGPTLDALRERGIDFGVLLCESNGRSTTLTQTCPSPDQAEPCAACVDNFDRNWTPQGIGGPLLRVLTSQGRPPALFVPMDAMAQELATDLASDGFASSRFERFSADDATPVQAAATRAVLALPYPEPDGATERWLAVLAAVARRRAGGWSFVLLGRGLDDRRLMSAGNVFATGPMTETDYADALVHYGAAALLAPQRWAGYGLVSRLAASHALPKAYFDWSIGAVTVEGADLSIDPRVCDAKAADVVCLWLDGLAPRRLS